ncbi:MAG: T9SS type A sorting domain-containing protein [Flavobacteriales bacterium]|nr:T9SS type A sorting domain-containing protein [Flavobacteriales bacterium]
MEHLTMRHLPLLILIISSASTQAQFGPQHFVFESDVKYPNRIWCDDLNGDGHQDVLAMDINGLYWWDNDGNGAFGDRKYVVNQFLSSNNLTTTDVDGDGDRDLIGQSGWWANDGSGNFSFVNNINPYLILAMVGDVDGDGDIDLVGRTGVLNGTVITFFGTIINDGNGNFSNGVQFSTNAPSAINCTQADFDGDGDLDLVIGGDANNNGFYPNLGGGTYGAQQLITGLSGTPEVHAGDADGNGTQDLFVFGGSPSARWFANDGNALFAVADTILGVWPAIDMDNDGDLDLSRGTGTSCDAKWYRNDGDGLAWSDQDVELFSGYNLVGTRYAYADFNEDGHPDMAICHGLGMIAWYPNNGDGTFALRERVGGVLSGGGGLSVADLDGDGDNDAVCASFYGDMLTAYLNNGNGTFGPQIVLAEHLDRINATAATDLNGDGLPELLTNKAQAAVFWNNGNGNFTASTLPNDGVALLAADLDGDFDPDLIASGKWYRNEGAGSFTEITEPLFAITGSAPAHAVDLNGDGIVDVLCRGSSINALINDGSGGFTVINSPATVSPNHSDAADMDLDGDIDLLALFGTSIWCYYNDGTGSFSEAQLTQPELGVPRHIIAHDVNGDGYPDALWARSNGYDHKTFANLNNGDGTIGAAFIIDPTAESTASLVFADMNGDVVPDLVAARFHSITWQENHFFDAFRLRGNVFKDFNNNAIEDGFDQPLAYLPMRTNPTGYLSWTNTAGGFDLPVDSGITYQMWPQLASQYVVTTTPDTAVVQANANEPIVDSLIFGVGPLIDDDIEAVSFTRTLLRCNTAGSFYIDVRNAGSSILYDIDISLALDADLTFVQAWPAPDSVVGNVVYWQLDSLAWWGLQHYRIDVVVGPVGSSGLATLDVLFGSTGELITETDGLETVTCAYDPNDKLVLPIGSGVHHAVPIDQDRLDYTIRFQNTGTDTAFNVLLIDRLSPHLDLTSMEVLGTSHPLSHIFIEDDRELNFRYDNILLPDSGTNMSGSNGYVRFRIRPLPNAPNLTEILNTAEIYFDYNPPVITNTTLNTLVDCEAFTATATDLGAGLLEASAGESYQWYESGIPIDGATQRELVAGASGFYSVEVTNEYACELLSEEVQIVISDVKETTGVRMAIMPNPMTNDARVIFSTPLASTAYVELIDINGKALRTIQCGLRREVLLQRDGLSSGLYILRVQDGKGSFATQRIVID